MASGAGGWGSSSSGPGPTKPSWWHHQSRGWFLRADHPGRVGGVHERGRSLERGPGAAAAAGAPDEGVGGVGEPPRGGARRRRVPPRRRRRKLSPRVRLSSTRGVFVSRAGYAHGAGGVLGAAPRRGVRGPPPRHASPGGGCLLLRRRRRRGRVVLRRRPRRLSPPPVDAGRCPIHRRGGRRDFGAGHGIGLSGRGRQAAVRVWLGRRVRGWLRVHKPRGLRVAGSRARRNRSPRAARGVGEREGFLEPRDGRWRVSRDVLVRTEG